MKNEVYLAIIVIMAVFVFQSFATKSYQEKKQESFTDLVCGMKVNSSDAFIYKYKGKKYYFDSYNCKQAFEMNPEKFINNKCVVPTDTTIHKK